MTPLSFTALVYLCSVAINFELFSNNYQYILLYIDITPSLPLALSICVLLILLMQSVKGAQFLNTTFLSALFASVAVAVAAVFGTVTVPLKACMYH